MLFHKSQDCLEFVSQHHSSLEGSLRDTLPGSARRCDGHCETGGVADNGVGGDAGQVVEGGVWPYNPTFFKIP